MNVDQHLFALELADGDSYLLIDRGRAAMIDAGLRRGLIGAVETLLVRHGAKLATITLSHIDNDHVRGAVDAITVLKPSEVWYPAEWDDLASAGQAGSRVAREAILQDLESLNWFPILDPGKYTGATVIEGLAEYLEMRVVDALGEPSGLPDRDAASVHEAEVRTRFAIADAWSALREIEPPLAAMHFEPSDRIGEERAAGKAATHLGKYAARAAKILNAMPLGGPVRRRPRLFNRHWNDGASASPRLRAVNSYAPGYVEPYGPLPNIPVAASAVLTDHNARSLVFEFRPEHAGEGGCLFTADSDLRFTQTVDWPQVSIITTPHHGSTNNDAAYQMIDIGCGVAGVAGRKFRWVKSRSNNPRMVTSRAWISTSVDARDCVGCNQQCGNVPARRISLVREGPDWQHLASAGPGCSAV